MQLFDAEQIKYWTLHNNMLDSKFCQLLEANNNMEYLRSKRLLILEV